MRGTRASIWIIMVLVALAAAAPAGAASAQRSPTEKFKAYHVRPGDTLWDIARRHGTTAERLAALNGISTEAILSIGQALRVPAGAAAARPARSRAGTEPPMTPAMRARLAAIPSRGEEWASTLMVISRRLIGIRYRWGGTTPAGFDCSGFLYYVFGRMGVELPRTTYSMFTTGAPVPRDELQVGDIVFFQTLRPGPSHAGVYLGDGRFIHSSSGIGRVTITPMNHRYYSPRYLGARRF